jgi:hypothetical protein
VGGPALAPSFPPAAALCPLLRSGGPFFPTSSSYSSSLSLPLSDPPPPPSLLPPACRRGHAERAAINTPIQGSAADVAAAAMVAISKCKELNGLGWKLLMQVRGGEGNGCVHGLRSSRFTSP